MIRLRIDRGAPLGAQLQSAVQEVQRAGVVGYPTDTLYGLAADPRSHDAVARVFAIKGRPDDKPVALIAADVTQAQGIAELLPAAMHLARQFWPGPLTLVLPTRVALARGVCSSASTVGVRVPDSLVARTLAQLFAHPITATSANRSGQPPTSDPEIVARTLPGLPLLLDDGPSRGGSTSTMVEVTSAGIRLIREGAIAWKRVLESLHEAPGAPSVLPDKPSDSPSRTS